GWRDEGELGTQKIGRKRRQTIVASLGKAILDRRRLALDVASFFQALAKCGYEGRTLGGRAAIEESYHRHSWLLRARRERPSSCSAEQRDEVAAFQLMEMHPIPYGPGAHSRIPDCNKLASGTSVAFGASNF